jgi:hypothetical protein
MSEMVYRVTRAICDNMNWSAAWPPCEYAGGVCPRCDCIFEGLGRGAIKAMREPTSEMIDCLVGWKAEDNHPYRDEVVKSYQAAIDHAAALPSQDRGKP